MVKENPRILTSRIRRQRRMDKLSRILTSSSSSPTNFTQPINSLSGQISPEFQRAFPPLPPLAPSPQLLRRAISDPAHLRVPTSDSKGLTRVSKNPGNAHQVFDKMSSVSRDENGVGKRKTRERSVGVERMEGDWTMLKLKCPCGSNYQLMISEVEKKCYYKAL